MFDFEVTKFIPGKKKVIYILLRLWPSHPQSLETLLIWECGIAIFTQFGHNENPEAGLVTRHITTFGSLMYDNGS